jgi:hypothetical protein
MLSDSLVSGSRLVKGEFLGESFRKTGIKHSSPKRVTNNLQKKLQPVYYKVNGAKIKNYFVNNNKISNSIVLMSIDNKIVKKELYLKK